MIIKIFKVIAWSMVCLIGVLILLVSFSVRPIDRIDYRKEDFYSRMQHNLDTLQELKIPPATDDFSVGFAIENITPPYVTSMAGSGPRKIRFEEVHDSIYVRTMVISNGNITVSLVSLDMLIVPPAVTKLLAYKLPAIGFDLNNTYLSATHTHSSIGNWGERLAGRIYSGPYDDSLVHFIADKIVKSVDLANQNKVKSSLKAGVIPVKGMLTNRLADEAGEVDSLMRIIEVNRADGKRLILNTFTGHPTCDKSSSLNISRDYPGVLVDKLEEQGYSFAMFMAGAVGSHACVGPERGEPRMNFVGETLSSMIIQHGDSLKMVHDSTLLMIRVPLELGEPQLKLTKNWCIRPWLFKAAFGEYSTSLTALRLGNVVMLGTPCDFSGELMPPIDSVASHHGLTAMVTSFNGAYIGYITLDKHYDIDHYETRVMNWYGPGNGAYLSECLVEMIEAIDH